MGDCAPPPTDMLLRLCAADRSTSRHSMPTSRTPGTPASSQLRSAGSHVPQSESARARESAPVATADDAAGVSSERRMIGSARRADRCSKGENGTVGTAGGAQEDGGDSVADDVERCRRAETAFVGLVLAPASERDDCRRCGLGVRRTSSGSSSRPDLESVPSVSGSDVGGGAAAFPARAEVVTAASEVDSCEIDSKDVFNDSSE